MPIYDRRCNTCDREVKDKYEPINTPAMECGLEECSGTLERVWLASGASVIGDQVDVWIRNGLCHADGSPRHFTSRAEIARVAKEKGLTNYVAHQGGKGSDKSKHTSKWT